MSRKSLALLMTVFLAFLAPIVADAHCDRCGRVKRLEPYTTSGSKTGGMVAGAIIGGALGNQVGKGDGRKAATVAGAVGGAYAGKKVAENSDRTRWKVTVRMAEKPAGDRLPVVDGKLVTQVAAMDSGSSRQ
jgi:uncharacterized protein YcfJ